MGHLLGYARVSTADQDPSLQLDALERAGCYRIYSETVSGSLVERPQLAALLDALRPGDTLVVWRLDRLGRSLRHLIETVQELDGREVGFRSVQESIDTTTPGGRLVFHVFAALAEFERDLIRERTVAGLSAARARGRVGGRPAVMTPAKLRQARRMQKDSVSPTEIATVLGVGRATVYRHLRATVPLDPAPPPSTAAEPNEPQLDADKNVGPPRLLASEVRTVEPPADASSGAAQDVTPGAGTRGQKRWYLVEADPRRAQAPVVVLSRYTTRRAALTAMATVRRTRPDLEAADTALEVREAAQITTRMEWDALLRRTVDRQGPPPG